MHRGNARGPTAEQVMVERRRRLWPTFLLTAALSTIPQLVAIATPATPAAKPIDPASIYVLAVGSCPPWRPKIRVCRHDVVQFAEAARDLIGVPANQITTLIDEEAMANYRALRHVEDERVEDDHRVEAILPGRYFVDVRRQKREDVLNTLHQDTQATRKALGCVIFGAIISEGLSEIRYQEVGISLVQALVRITYLFES